jgi:hypothetical protein
VSFSSPVLASRDVSVDRLKIDHLAADLVRAFPDVAPAIV